MWRNNRTVFVVFLVVMMCTLAYSRASRPRSIVSGTWGADHIRINVVNGSATIDYDCANGIINGPLSVDRAGKFNLNGSHIRERGGPIRRDQKTDRRPARYTGWTDGRKMMLTVILTDTNEEIGTFTLVRGEQGRVWKCK